MSTAIGGRYCFHSIVVPNEWEAVNRATIANLAGFHSIVVPNEWEVGVYTALLGSDYGFHSIVVPNEWEGSDSKKPT